MTKGLYISASNLIQNTQRLDVISNNLANLETTGYKRDAVDFESFNERLQYRIHGSNIPWEMGRPNVEMTKEDDSFVFKTSSGYFRVQTPDGIHYTKEMRAIIDPDGMLKTEYRTTDGFPDYTRANPILSDKGPIRIGSGELNVQPDGTLATEDGTVQLIQPSTPTAVGTISAGLKTYKLRTVFEQGNIVNTENSMDFALKGEGFFAVKNEKGDKYYTRNGALSLNQEGALCTLDGMKLVGLNGPVIMEDSNFAINDFGEVIQHGEIVDKIELVQFTRKADILKVGANLFRSRDYMEGTIEPFGGEVIQGAIEGSNVAPVVEMIKMIQLNRTYESSQKVVHSIDDMLGKAVNEISKV